MKKVIERFFKKVHKTKTCWKWLACKNGYYGSFNIGNKKSMPAHRFSYELVKGKIPRGLHIDHLCLNKLCVNPKHLEAVTQGENNKRAWDNRRKNYCPNGHKFTEKNTIRYVWRVCKICKRLANRKWYQIHKKKYKTHQGPNNKDKTHCNRGHMFTKKTTYLYRGSRYCIPCHRINNQNYRIRKS